MLLVAAACSGAPTPSLPAAGLDTPVEVLDRAWVRFEGERRPVEFFLLEVRLRVRAASGSGALPRVVVRIVDGAPGVDPQWLDWLRNELYRAGVQRIALGEA